MTTALDFDTTEALGLDGTGRDLNPAFPYTVEGLSDEKLLLLVFASDYAFHYPEEAAEGPWPDTTANYYEVAGAVAEARFGRDHLENISTYAVQWHASIEDLITSMQTDPASILTILRDGVEE